MRDGNGTRVMYAYSSLSSDFGTWLGESTTLQHEAYRDGIVGATKVERDYETFKATKAHTEMALRLANTYGGSFITADSNLTRDVGAYYLDSMGLIGFDEYVGTTYNSSADYWLLTKSGVLAWDGKAALTWEATGKVIDPGKKNETPEAALLRYMGGVDAAKKYLTSIGVKGLEDKSESEIGSMLLEVKGVNKKNNTYELTTAQSNITFNPSENLQKNYVAVWNSWDSKKNLQRHFTSFYGEHNSYYNLYFKYMETAEVRAAGNPMAWIDKNIETTTFFGQKFSVNKELTPLLQKIEAQMKSEGISYVPDVNGGFNPRFQGDSFDLSNHAFGRAIDFEKIEYNSMLIFDDDGPNKTANKIIDNDTNGDIIRFINYMAGRDIRFIKDYDPLHAISQQVANPAIRQQYVDKFLQEWQGMSGGNYNPGGIADSRALEQLAAAYKTENQRLYDFLTVEVKVGKSNLTQFERFVSSNWGQNGFVNLNSDFVRIMKNNGFNWGGTWGRFGRFDSMHFERRIY